MQCDECLAAAEWNSLLESLYKGWPVGSFYLWHRRCSPRKTAIEKSPARYLLDGQQRLASLSRAIKDACGDTLLPPPGRRQSQAISWCAFFDVANEGFVLKGRRKASRSGSS